MRHGHYHREGLSGYAYATGDAKPSAWKRAFDRWWPLGLLLALIALFCDW